MSSLVIAALPVVQEMLDLYSQHSQNKKIEKNDFNQLGTLITKLNNQLQTNRDLLSILMKAEQADARAGDIQDFYVWFNREYYDWPDDQKDVRWKVVSPFAIDSLTKLGTMIQGDLRMEILKVPANKDKYENYTTKASDLVQKIVNQTDMPLTMSDMQQLRNQFQSLISTVYLDMMNQPKTSVQATPNA